MNDLKPFIKWLGGKHQMIPTIRSITEKITFDNYIEPFIGGGSILFEYQPKQAVINDLNAQLITTYKVIRDNCSSLIEALKTYDTAIPGDVYYEIRKEYNNLIETNDKSNNIKLAAMFIWLNKHCFNGLYRVNKKGLFNSPWNKKNIPFQSTSFENLITVSNYLKTVKITNSDFSECLDNETENINSNTFVFLDPPYAKYGNSTFTQYTKSDFNDDMQIKVFKYFLKLNDLGAKVMLTNYPNEDFINLFKNKYSGTFNIHELDVSRNINRIGTERKSKEIIITNF